MNGYARGVDEQAGPTPRETIGDPTEGPTEPLPPLMGPASPMSPPESPARPIGAVLAAPEQSAARSPSPSRAGSASAVDLIERPSGTMAVELADDPFDDDLTEQLAARANRPWATRSTMAMAALVLVVGGFLAGAQVQKHFGVSGTGTGGAPTGVTRSGLGGGGYGGYGGSGLGGNAAGGNAAGGNAASGNAITGTVKMVDGNTVYVQTAGGQTVIVHTSSTTSVNQPGSVADLTSGAQVTVNGQTGSDGSVTATSITKGK